MASLYNADLKPLEPGTSTHPYEHAAKLFLADTFKLAPKQSFLYYVCINIDKTVYQAYQSAGLGGALNALVGDGGVSSQSLIEQYEAGMLAKRVDLPKFNLNTKTLNAYNRKNIIQTHISYEPITITFHDDAADVVTRFWNDYYTYYYRDSDYTNTQYQLKHKYTNRTQAGWGYTPRNSSLVPFLRNIQIFSLHNKRFTEYLLINPYITNWRHGEHNSSGGGETMENTMTVAYETVKYRTGYVNPVDVNGFGILHYDNFNSPISTSVTNIYTDGGFLGAVTGGSKDLARPDGANSGGNLLNQVAGAARFYNNIKNANFQSIAGTVLGQVGAQVLNGAANGAADVIFPTFGGQEGYGGVYGSSGVYSNPSTMGFGGIVTGIANSFTDSITGAFSRGRSIFDVSSPNGVIKLDSYGQPVTGTVNSVVLDDNGQPVSQFSSSGTSSGRYDPKNPDLNLVSLQTTTDENNDVVSVRTYRDGSQVVNNASGEQIAYVPGTNATVPTTSSGGPLAGQTYTDAASGITYGPGSLSTALLGSSFGGATPPFVPGQDISSVFKGVLGSSLSGRSIESAVSGIAGGIINKGYGFMQGLVNPLTGKISQVFNSATGEIKNVISSWTGTGGRMSGDANQNLVARFEQDGKVIELYKDGTTVVDGVVTPGPNGDQFVGPPYFPEGTVPGQVGTGMDGSPVEFSPNQDYLNDPSVSSGSEFSPDQDYSNDPEPTSDGGEAPYSGGDSWSGEG